jgi:hypothetical protein
MGLWPHKEEVLSNIFFSCGKPIEAPSSYSLHVNVSSLTIAELQRKQRVIEARVSVPYGTPAMLYVCGKQAWVAGSGAEGLKKYVFFSIPDGLDRDHTDTNKACLDRFVREIFSEAPVGIRTPAPPYRISRSA